MLLDLIMKVGFRKGTNPDMNMVVRCDLLPR
jgi:hypothetical protein